MNFSTTKLLIFSFCLVTVSISAMQKDPAQTTNPFYGCATNCLPAFFKLRSTASNYEESKELSSLSLDRLYSCISACETKFFREILHNEHISCREYLNFSRNAQNHLESGELLSAENYVVSLCKNARHTRKFLVKHAPEILKS